MGIHKKNNFFNKTHHVECNFIEHSFPHRDLVKSNGIPWIAVTVWGFTDCPVTWKQNEHGHFFSGENFYTFVVFPNDKYWLYTAMGSHDIGL